MPVFIQKEDFDLNKAIATLRAGNGKIGAIASFIGIARDINQHESVQGLVLEHYPGMTEKTLQKLIDQTKQRWNIFDALIIHRIGVLKPQDQIVLVAVSSEHRAEALQACQFVMDFLKTSAPFWKKELTVQGERWITPRESDMQAIKNWDSE